MLLSSISIIMRSVLSKIILELNDTTWPGHQSLKPYYYIIYFLKIDFKDLLIVSNLVFLLMGWGRRRIARIVEILVLFDCYTITSGSALKTWKNATYVKI